MQGANRHKAAKRYICTNRFLSVFAFDILHGFCQLVSCASYLPSINACAIRSTVVVFSPPSLFNNFLTWLHWTFDRLQKDLIDSTSSRDSTTSRRKPLSWVSSATLKMVFPLIQQSFRRCFVV